MALARVHPRDLPAEQSARHSQTVERTNVCEPVQVLITRTSMARKFYPRGAERGRSNGPAHWAYTAIIGVPLLSFALLHDEDRCSTGLIYQRLVDVSGVPMPQRPVAYRRKQLRPSGIHREHCVEVNTPSP